MRGRSLTGYNRHTGKVEAAWIDTVDPYLLVQRGTFSDDGATLTLDGSGDSAWGPAPLRNVYRFGDDPDRYVIEFFSRREPDGPWEPAGEIVARRADR